MERTAVLNRRAFLGGLLAGVALGSAPALTAVEPAERTLAGLFPIGFTPVNSDDTVDFDGLAAQVEFCRRGGVHGLAWPQFASGWTTLSETERLTGAEAIVNAGKGGRTAVVIGVQSREGNFAETQRYAKHAEKIGADAIICIPPGMVDSTKPIGVSPHELLSFYQQLGQLTRLPLFVQTVSDFSVDLLVDMSDSIPTFHHVKDEAGDPLQRVSEITRRTNGRLKCFSGGGAKTLITEMERGFVGHCPYASLADLFASAFDLFHAGKLEEAFDQFGRIQAASSMFFQGNINVLIARGVFKSGTKTRISPGATFATAPATSSDEIKRVLDTYLKPYLRA
jgi:dihydrodipicolinate synthase/N-acetylneuraminate lyase